MTEYSTEDLTNALKENGERKRSFQERVLSGTKPSQGYVTDSLIRLQGQVQDKSLLGKEPVSNVPAALLSWGQLSLPALLLTGHWGYLEAFSFPRAPLQTAGSRKPGLLLNVL